jgi:uncharacterized protein (DUF58 family)
MSALLDPKLLLQLERFQLLAARHAKSAAKGERRSRSRGQSVEFADHRNYVPGDDLRYLDWNLYGRLDRLYLKLYEEERELPVRIFLDASESMNFGSPSKFRVARQIAAAIGYVGLCGFDRVGVVVFPDAGGESEMLPRGALRQVRGKRASQSFFRNLEALGAAGPGDLNGALKRAALEARQPGAAVVISDFLDPAGYEAGLTALLARGNQVNAIQVLAPEELEPTRFGDLKMVDSETGVETEVTFGKYRLDAYRRTVANYVQRLREFCTGRGIRFFSVSAGTPVEHLLLKQFRASQLWA